MKQDVIACSRGEQPGKILSKETLNNRWLIEQASGIDPVKDTRAAFLEAYRALGIDFVNRVPEKNCPEPLPPGESVEFDHNYKLSSLGLYDTFYRYRYPYERVDQFLEGAGPELLEYGKLRTPVPHPLELEDIRLREGILGDTGFYYCQLYTTLFMWGIEYLGWEVFMMALALDPEQLEHRFLQPAFEQTLRLTDILLESESPYLFFHDDIATGSGLACQKSWLEEYIFPRYRLLWEQVHEKGKQVIFVCDGNITDVLEEIRDTGVDGVMLENPATPFEKILQVFHDKLVIGGIDTAVLSNGSPDAVRTHVEVVMEQAEKQKKFALSSCGGLHGGIPEENLEAYFDTRARYGINRADWRWSERKQGI